MKTNIVMKSRDRSLFGVIIRQETKTGFLSVSDLTKAYETERSKKGWSCREPKDILKLDSNAERIFYILQKQGYLKDTVYDLKNADNQDYSIKGNILRFMEDVKKQGLPKILKSLKAYKTTGRGDNKFVSCDPYIWMLIAMELHPEIYATTVCWLADKLLLNRIEAGNMYPVLSRAASKFADVDYSKLGQALNYIVFGKHESGIRNNADQAQLKELEDLEKNFAFGIAMGHIKSFDDLISDMRRIYADKQITGHIKLIA